MRCSCLAPGTHLVDFLDGYLSEVFGVLLQDVSYKCVSKVLCLLELEVFLFEGNEKVGIVVMMICLLQLDFL